MTQAVGIDLGTTNSVLAAPVGRHVVVVPNAEGERVTPSAVAFTEADGWLVGRAARRQAALDPENTVTAVKRFVGVPLQDRKEAAGRMLYWVVPGAAHEPLVYLPASSAAHAPEEIAAMILYKLKTDAERYLGEPVTQAVIAVPAHFSEDQRGATGDAARLARLDPVATVDEPVAAAVAYGLDETAGTVLVWDVGGATFDVSVLEVREDHLEVVALAGDAHLGGGDYDRRIAEHAAEQLRREHGVDLRRDRRAMQRLLEAAERARIELSDRPETDLILPSAAAAPGGPRHLSVALTREAFEALTGDLTERCVPLFWEALGDAGVGPDQLGAVVLAGGATRMPAVQRLVRTLTRREPLRAIPPDEVVAVGAALLAAAPAADPAGAGDVPPAAAPRTPGEVAQTATGIAAVWGSRRSASSVASVSVSRRKGTTTPPAPPASSSRAP
jgi:molecular chaperone DnaK